MLFFQCRTRSFQSLFGCVLAPVFGNIVNKVFRHLSSKSPLCNVEFELKFVAGTWKNNRPKNQQFQGQKLFHHAPFAPSAESTLGQICHKNRWDITDFARHKRLHSGFAAMKFHTLDWKENMTNKNCKILWQLVRTHLFPTYDGFLHYSVQRVEVNWSPCQDRAFHAHPNAEVSVGTWYMKLRLHSERRKNR